MELIDALIDDLIGNLNGSCMSLEAGLLMVTDDEVEDVEQFSNSTEILQKLDEQIFNCVVCGWWQCVSEIHEDESQGWMCEECGED